tara:strand:+ start:866 stop:1423 length:558 start_codon:yes stop_codon:yes gene_type:complete
LIKKHKCGKSYQHCGVKWEKVGLFSIFTNYFINMISILGTYQCKADSKGRVMLPNNLRKQLLPIITEGFVIKRSVFYKCLELHPMTEWNELMNKVNKLNRFVKKNNDFIRTYMSGLRQVETDSSGRFLIPKDLFLFAELKKDIVLSSSVNMVEIWSKDNYEVSVQNTMKDFANLSEEVMGDKLQD